jgi:arylsulfatase A-like enzyme
MRILIPALALLTAAFSVTCSRHRVDPATVRADDLNVVLLILDAAGARYFGVYGNPLPTTPNVDALAADGATVFTRAYAQASWTLPSMASVFVGRYPMRRLQTRMRVHGQTLATVLQDAHVLTAAFSENPYITSTFGFDRGFDVFREYLPESVLHQEVLSYTTTSDVPTSDAIAWLEANAGRRTFLYLHLLRPHNPYHAPAPYGAMFDPEYTGPLDGKTETLLQINNGTLVPSQRDIDHLRFLYQENLAYGDHQVARVLDTLRRLGTFDRTIVIVAADHGEAFREHGVMLHTSTLFEEMIHVPLVIRMPPRFGPMPPRFDGIVELRDLLPTLCHALSLQCEVGTARSLLHPLRASTPAPRVARAWTSPIGWLALGAIVTPDRKLIIDMPVRRLTLYDLRHDPNETRNIVDDERPRAHRMARRLRKPKAMPAPTRGPGVVGDDTVRKLQALGYTAQ